MNEQKGPPVTRVTNQDGTILTGWKDGTYVIINPRTGEVVDENNFPNPARAAAWASGDTSAQDAVQAAASGENTRRWDATFEQRDRELAQRYKIDLANAKTQQQQAQATREYQQGQLQNLRDRLAFDREKQAQDLGLSQAQLGYNVVKTMADYQRPEDHFKEAEYARGVAGNPNTSTFLSALQNNQRMAGFNARGGAAVPASADGMMAKLTGTAGAGNENNYLAQIGNIAVKGPHQLGAGALEQLTDTERKLFTAGLSKLGYDPSTFLSGYARSRIGNRTGSALAA